MTVRRGPPVTALFQRAGSCLWRVRSVSPFPCIRCTDCRFERRAESEQ
jgi:hypothetical protein